MLKFTAPAILNTAPFFQRYPKVYPYQAVGGFCECKTTRHPLGPEDVLFFMLISRLSSAIEEIGTSIIFNSYLGIYYS